MLSLGSFIDVASMIRVQCPPCGEPLNLSRRSDRRGWVRSRNATWVTRVTLTTASSALAELRRVDDEQPPPEPQVIALELEPTPLTASTSGLTLSLGVREYFAATHLWSAEYTAEQCLRREQELLSIRHQGVDLRQRSLCVASVFSAVAFLRLWSTKSVRMPPTTNTALSFHRD